MQKAVNFFNLIIAFCLFVAACLVLGVSTFTTIYYDMHYDEDWPQYGKENIPLLIILVLLVLAAFLFLYRKKLFKEKSRLFMILGLVMITAYCLMLILSIKPRAVNDSKTLDDIINLFVQGDYSALTEKGGYLFIWPFQLGYVAFGQLMVRLFGPSNYFAWDILQLICILITIYLIYKITWELFGDKTICGIVGLLSIGALFFYNYVTYIYGDIISMAPQTIALYMMILYVKRDKIRYAVISAAAIAFAIMIKTNCEVTLIALLMILLGNGIIRTISGATHNSNSIDAISNASGKEIKEAGNSQQANNGTDQKLHHEGVHLDRKSHHERTHPDRKPTINPDRNPTINPDRKPTINPDRNPTINPDRKPTINPDRKPTINPDGKPALNSDERPALNPLITSILLAGLFLVLTFAVKTAVNTYYCNLTGLESIPEGNPSWAHIAMGLQESPLEDGWYNGYNYKVFEENDYDTAATAAAARENIMQTLQSFVARPLHGARFLTRKFTTQWADSVCISTHNLDLVSRHVENPTALGTSLVFGTGSKILIWVMNVFMPICYIGVAIYLFGILRGRKASVEEMLLLILIFGGIVFHEFWEGSSRYTMRYYIYWLPYSACGLKVLLGSINEHFKRKI